MSVSLELVLQLMLLMALGAFVPLRLARLLPWRLGMVPVNIALSCLILLLAGAALMTAPYVARGDAVWAALRSDPAGGLRWLAWQGLLPLIAWAPVLALTVFGIAQRIAQSPAPRGSRA